LIVERTADGRSRGRRPRRRAKKVVHRAKEKKRRILNKEQGMMKEGGRERMINGRPACFWRLVFVSLELYAKD